MGNKYIHSDDGDDDGPTVGMVDMKELNSKLLISSKECKWGLQPYRSTTTSAYGWIEHPEERIGNSIVAKTDQFALDDILFTRISTYPKLIPNSSPSNHPTLAHGKPQSTFTPNKFQESSFTSLPDFYYLPALTMYLPNLWGCNSNEFKQNITEQINWIREIIKNEPESSYPKFILPLAPIRHLLEKSNFLIPEVLAEFENKVILVGIEGAANLYEEELNYVIDLPYPTTYHLPRTESSSAWVSEIGEDSFHQGDRKFLLHYAAGTTHPWGTADSDPFNGFALRKVLAAEFRNHAEVTSPDAPRYRSTLPKIIFDEIKDSRDGSSDLDLFAQHMRNSTFCPQPPGDSPTRRGFYDAILNGCIPVIFREFSYGRLLPSSVEMEASLFTVFIPENEIISGQGYNLITRLTLISQEEIQTKQRHLKSIARKIQWTIPTSSQPLPLATNGDMLSNAFSEDAFGMLLKELDTIRRGDWKGRRTGDKRIQVDQF